MTSQWWSWPAVVSTDASMRLIIIVIPRWFRTASRDTLDLLLTCISVYANLFTLRITIAYMAFGQIPVYMSPHGLFAFLPPANLPSYEHTFMLLVVISYDREYFLTLCLYLPAIPAPVLSPDPCFMYWLSCKSFNIFRMCSHPWNFYV